MVLLTSKPNLEDFLNPLCFRSFEDETTVHVFLRRQVFIDVREIVMNDQMNIDRSLPSPTQHMQANLCCAI